MSLINKEQTLEALKNYGKEIADANADGWTMMVAQAIVRNQEEVICECELAENAATICAVLDADAEGRVWRGEEN